MPDSPAPTIRTSTCSIDTILAHTRERKSQGRDPIVRPRRRLRPSAHELTTCDHRGHRAGDRARGHRGGADGGHRRGRAPRAPRSKWPTRPTATSTSRSTSWATTDPEIDSERDDDPLWPDEAIVATLANDGAGDVTEVSVGGAVSAAAATVEVGFAGGHVVRPSDARRRGVHGPERRPRAVRAGHDHTAGKRRRATDPVSVRMLDAAGAVIGVRGEPGRRAPRGRAAAPRWRRAGAGGRGPHVAARRGGTGPRAPHGRVVRAGGGPERRPTRRRWPARSRACR